MVSTEPEVNKFLENVLSQIKDWLEESKIKKLVVGLKSVETKETLERWEFKIESEKGVDGKQVETSEKDEKKIKAEIRDVIRQITASVTFLPLLDCLCSFDILIYSHSDTAVPAEWAALPSTDGQARGASSNWRAVAWAFASFPVCMGPLQPSPRPFCRSGSCTDAAAG